MRVPQFIRQFTDPLLERIPVPIMSGVNRGRRWNLASAGSGYATGRRAAAQMGLLADCMQAGDVVWDVGAHHGFVTLAASARVGARGWVHAFEPSAGNRRLLERHVRWNALTNTTVHSVALASYAGTARFGGGDTSKMHALGSGEETVTVDTGSAMVRSAQLRVPTFLKIDVEGAEADMLAGVREVLPSHARLVIAMHSAEADAACCRLLDALGFHLFPSVALQQSREGAWHGDPDLFAAGPAYAALPTVRPLLDRHRF